ncbi:hypothetical protein NEOLEDRAFT_1132914 [Neolentinus lepideus HHB14362 ss-1]|uniref:C2H2-type domain-containing protein n=1 Tax=Neolentinus lepideus HHB14362 ss-1 TaxID=1314782 RepID=A0A165SZ56_9AGAM|nr:hypothetical protein NEOLEDRAFT_1132914 [Neolentinus lepideus HHB14362 ss-1]
MAETTSASVQTNVGGLSLLSLSIVASNAVPIPVPTLTRLEAAVPEAVNYGSVGSFNGTGTSVNSGSVYGHGSMKHRRLSSTGQTRRRLSDARDAAARPTSQTAATLSSLAALSLSSTPPPAQGVFKLEKSASLGTLSTPIPIPAKEEGQNQGVDVSGTGKGKTGKKRGTIFQCESCSKVYRHPSCLIKHRWEHSPHWREASKFVLSKHQQVQLLEAAAILSHLKPAGTSLPDDRSLWPSFLSGGLLPPPSTTNLAVNGTTSRSKSSSTSTPSSFTGATSSSVPAYKLSGRSGSSGPRLHDYSVSPANGGITHIRPGLVGVPTSTTPGPEEGRMSQSSAPVPVPVASSVGGFSYLSASGGGESWVSYPPSSASPATSTSLMRSQSQSEGWSLPSSSLRSRSGSRSDEDEEFVDVGDADAGVGRTAGRVGFLGRGWEHVSVKEEDEEELGRVADEEWDGMDMDMD